MSTPANLKLQALAESAITPRSWSWYLTWGILLALLAWSWQGADMRPMELWRDSGNMKTYAAEFSPEIWPLAYLFGRDADHLADCFVGYGIGCGDRHPDGAFGLVQYRSLVGLSTRPPGDGRVPGDQRNGFAMLFVVAVGLGPFAGVLALWVHTTGILAKLFSEAVEAIDPQPVEGIRSTGASALHEIVYGVIPQVTPLWISFALYRFESNVRSATVVGMVGAGGIGVVLWEIIRGFQYGETCAVMLIIVATVSLIDLISARIRKLFV